MATLEVVWKGTSFAQTVAIYRLIRANPCQGERAFKPARTLHEWAVTAESGVQPNLRKRSILLGVALLSLVSALTLQAAERLMLRIRALLQSGRKCLKKRWAPVRCHLPSRFAAAGAKESAWEPDLRTQQNLMGAPCSRQRTWAEKTGDPDFLPRCTRQSRVCAFP